MDEELYDPECSACERAQKDYADLEAVADDLAALVRRLAHALDKPSGNTLLARQAMDYLRRIGLSGSPLRETPNDEAHRKDAAGGLSGGADCSAAG